MNPYIAIIRIGNCVMSVVAVLLVGIISVGYGITSYLLQLTLGILTVFLITAGGNVINDYYDREVDKINHPERPIPSGKIKPQTAVIYSAFLFSGGILSSYFISTCALLVASYAVFMLLLYESSLKYEGLAGNIAVSILVGMLFVYGGVIFGNLSLMAIFATMAFFANLGREIIKDVEDMAGDINRRTLPKKIGRKKASLLAMSFLYASVLISPLPYLLFGFSIYYILAVLVSDGIFIYAAHIQFKDPHAGQKYVKYAMLAGLIAYLVGGLT